MDLIMGGLRGRGSGPKVPLETRVKRPQSNFTRTIFAFLLAV